ncbi:MAG: hypothetical protein H6Q74_1233 [Firmicutes bacterium]|nr:hypothetical protein [Bacillota bacterium]
MKIKNVTANCLLVPKAQVADSFFSRLKGLLGSARLDEEMALVICPCSSVHTFGMRYVIDVVFVDVNHQVVKVVANLAPGKMAWCRKSHYVVELAAGSVAATGLRMGDKLEFAYN